MSAAVHSSHSSKLRTERDREVRRCRGNVVRVHFLGGSYDSRHRHESHRREVEHRRGRGESGTLRGEPGWEQQPPICYQAGLLNEDVWVFLLDQSTSGTPCSSIHPCSIKAVFRASPSDVRCRNITNSSVFCQVASARFGVTSAYLANADELQIKMAQGLISFASSTS